MSKVYILRVSDPEDSWIGGVYATRELAYKEAMEYGNKHAELDGTHLIEAAHAAGRIFFAENDDFVKTNCWWTEYIIDEWEVKDAETDD